MSNRPNFKDNVKNCRNCIYLEVKYCTHSGYPRMKIDEPERCICDLFTE